MLIINYSEWFVRKKIDNLSCSYKWTVEKFFFVSFCLAIEKSKLCLLLKDSLRCQGAKSWYSYSSLDVNNYRHYLVQKWNPMWDLPPQYWPRPFQKIGFVHSFPSDNTGQSWKCWYHGYNLYASKWPWGVEASCRSNRRTMLVPMPHHLSQVIYLTCSWHCGWVGSFQVCL